jgi:lipopolysaccharide transport system permease protein
MVAVEGELEPNHVRQEPTPRVRIKPVPSWPRLDLHELWAYRGLLFFLVWRDVKVRYAQTILGAGWAILQPLISVVVFTIIFGRFARIPSDGVPYGVFSLAALVPWTYFSTSLNGSSNSLVSSAGLLTKVYFPRLLIPATPAFAALVDFTIGLLLLIVVLLAYGFIPHVSSFLLVPALLAMVLMTAVGVGSFLAALNIQYRDVKQITPFLVQIWMYASPIVYPLSVIPEHLRAIYAVNPMVGVVTGFRAVLLQQVEIPWSAIITGAISSAILLFLGTLYFRRTERIFADVA